MKILLLKLIGLYRAAISPMLGQHCRFYPSCSCYAHEAIVRFGALRGTALTFGRLVRCHPFHPGGVDMVPDTLPPLKLLPFKIREL